MSKFGALAPSDKPFRTYLKLNGDQIVDKDGNPAFIDVYHEDSSVGRRYDKEHRAKLLANSKNGVEQPTQLETNADKCAALTVSWYLVDPETLEPLLDGDAPMPCTRENAMDLYSRPLTIWLWGQPWADANNHANFIKRSAKNSTSTQSGTSETAAS